MQVMSVQVQKGLATWLAIIEEIIHTAGNRGLVW